MCIGTYTMTMSVRSSRMINIARNFAFSWDIFPGEDKTVVIDDLTVY